MEPRLQSFLAVCRTGSLTAAADRLNLTQPSLTKRLRLLEEEYGQRLFERRVTGTRPTDAGLALLHHAERIEAEYQQSREAVAAASNTGVSVLRIGAGPLFHLRYLAEPLIKIRTRFPKTRLEVTTGLYRETMPRLTENTIDIVFGADEGLSTDDQLRFIPLTRVEQCVALRAGHPVLARDRIDAATLSDLEWIVYGDRERDAALIRGFFGRSGYDGPRLHMVTSSFTLGLQVVARSNHAMMIPRAISTRLNVDGVVSRMTHPPIADLPAGAFLRASTVRYPIIRALLDAVDQSIADEA